MRPIIVAYASCEATALFLTRTLTLSVDAILIVAGNKTCKVGSTLEKNPINKVSITTSEESVSSTKTLHGPELAEAVIDFKTKVSPGFTVYAAATSVLPTPMAEK